VICDFSNHGFIRIIPDPASTQRIMVSLESIHTVPLQVGAIYVKIFEWGQYGYNCRSPCLFGVFTTFWGMGDQQNENPDALFKCAADIFSNITSCEIQRPLTRIARKIGQVSIVECTNPWHNHHSGRESILHIPSPITHV